MFSWPWRCNWLAPAKPSAKNHQWSFRWDLELQCRPWVGPSYRHMRHWCSQSQVRRAPFLRPRGCSRLEIEEEASLTNGENRVTRWAWQNLIYSLLGSLGLLSFNYSRETFQPRWTRLLSHTVFSLWLYLHSGVGATLEKHRSSECIEGKANWFLRILQLFLSSDARRLLQPLLETFLWFGKFHEESVLRKGHDTWGKFGYNYDELSEEAKGNFALTQWDWNLRTYMERCEDFGSFRRWLSWNHAESSGTISRRKD